MSFDDSNNTIQPSDSSAAPQAQPQPVTAVAPLAPADQASPASAAGSATPNDTQSAPASSNDGRIPTFPQNQNRSVRPTDQESQGQIVSNPSQAGAAGAAAASAFSDHPAVRKAGLLHAVGETLAGGPRYTESIDADGKRTYKKIPLSGRQIALAIAMEAISGSLSGLAAGRGRGAGAAGLAGFQQVQKTMQARQDRQDQQAQEDFDNRNKVLVSKASIAEVNSRTILNTAEAERFGVQAIDKAVEINRGSGVLDIDPAGLDNDGQPMTQAEMMDAIKSGRISTMDHLGPIAGRVQVTNPDGSTRWEATHLIVRDPSSKVPVTQEQWDRFVAGNVPGFPSAKLANGQTELKISTIQRANEILAAHSLTDYRLKEIKDVLAGTPWADKVPSSVDFSQPGVETAMQRFQKYVSHSAQHGMDVFESLQAMGADKRDAKSGVMQPNPDAKYVDVVAQQFGGWPVLQAVHNQLAADRKTATEFSIIDSEAKANAVLATPAKFTRDQVSSAKNFLALSQQQGARKAAEDARARAVAEGKDTEAMYKTGVNPITGERLTLANAPDSMLVDSKGRPVPQNMQSFYKPSQNERQTADTARQALAISADLRAAVQKNPNLVGPLLGNSKSGLAKLGLGDAEAQKMLNDISFLQSASTKVHTGRFSSEILKKMGNMIKPGMNLDQFVGGLNSIDEVMGRYAKEDQLITVADYKQMQSAPANANAAQAPPASLLKEGINTTFKNGQVWTLRNGQPEQVK